MGTYFYQSCCLRLRWRLEVIRLSPVSIVSPNDHVAACFSVGNFSGSNHKPWAFQDLGELP